MNVTNKPHHADNTWTKMETGTNWLRDLLPGRLPRARITAYQYNANVVFSSSHAGVDEQAKNMLVFLSAKRKNCCTRPIIFIAHSLGGLIVKAALAEAYHGDGTYTMIQTMTYGIVFFGVPHQGSDNVPWGRVVARIVSSYDGRINESFMQSVESGSPYNERLRKRFMPLLAKYKFLSICETLEEVKHGVNLGVVSFSILFPASRCEETSKEKKDCEKEIRTSHSQEIKIYPNRSHSTICKFDGENDPVWEQVSDVLYHGALSALEYPGYRPIVSEWAIDVDDDIRHLTGTLHEVVTMRQAIVHAQDSLTYIEEDSEQVYLQREVKHHNSVIVAQALWIMSFLAPLLAMAHLVGIILSIASAVAPSKETTLEKLEKAAESQREVVVLQHQAINTLDNKRIRALRAIRMIQLASNTLTVEPDKESGVYQVSIDLFRKLDEQTERIMRGLRRHSIALSKAERRLGTITSGIEEAKDMDKLALLKLLHEKGKEEEAKAREDPPDDLFDDLDDDEMGPCDNCVIL